MIKSFRDFKKFAIPLGAAAAIGAALTAIGSQRLTTVAASAATGSGLLVAQRLRTKSEHKRFIKNELRKTDAAIELTIFLEETGIHGLPDSSENQVDYRDESEAVTKNFTETWQSYSKDRFEELLEFDPVIEVLFEYSDYLNNNYSFHSEPHPPLQTWVRKALCASAISIHFCSERSDEWFKEEVREKAMFFVLNLRREWAEFLVRLLVFLDAMEQIIQGVDKTDAYNSSLDRFFDVIAGIYEDINAKCLESAKSMDSWVKQLIAKSEYRNQTPPEMHISDIEDGRQMVFWGDADADWKHGRSCTYLVDWNGGASVKETSEFVVFKDWRQFPFIAATIVQDIFGTFDHESAIKLLEQDIATYLTEKKRQKS